MLRHCCLQAPALLCWSSVRPLLLDGGTISGAYMVQEACNAMQVSAGAGLLQGGMAVFCDRPGGPLRLRSLTCVSQVVGAQPASPALCMAVCTAHAVLRPCELPQVPCPGERGPQSLAIQVGPCCPVLQGSRVTTGDAASSSWRTATGPTRSGQVSAAAAQQQPVRWDSCLSSAAAHSSPAGDQSMHLQRS